MKWSRGFAFCTAFTLQLSCNHVSTQRFLDADFLSREGQTSPTLIAPLNNAAAALDTVFSWSMVPGALKYRIEMSAVQDFSTVHLRAEIKTTNYTIATSDIRGAASLPQQNYYWRVAAIFFSGELVSSVFRFILLDKDILYVDVASTAASANGALLTPFKNIQSAIAFAAANNRTVIFVSKGDYNESIVLSTNISILGGYDAAANWSRNILGNLTRIRTNTVFYTVLINSSISNASRIEGFTIQNNATAFSTSYAVFNNGGSPIIDSNVITGGGCATNYGIYTDNLGAPTISNNTVTGGSGASNYGLANTSAGGLKVSSNTITGGSGGTLNVGVWSSNTSSPTISGNTILGGTGAGNNYGIEFSSSVSPSVTGNTISGGTINATANQGIRSTNTSGIITNNTVFGNQSNVGTGIFLQSGSNTTVSGNNITGGLGGVGSVGFSIFNASPVVFNNQISAGTSASYANGLTVQNSSATIANNTIYGHNGGASATALLFYAGATVTVRNNIMFCAGSGYAVQESAVSSDPTVFQNNYMYNCFAIYRDDDTAADIMTTATIVQPENATLASMGNVSGLGNPFVSIAGVDGINGTLADNDWRPLSAGICNIRGGGRDLSSLFATDKNGATRTAADPGCGPTNTGWQGWSIGAFERD